MVNKSNKTVTFHPEVSCFEIMSLYDYTDNEVSAAWYNDEEMCRITNRCVRLIQRMDAGQAEKYCTRGLESHATLGCISKRKNRTLSLATVLVEQSIQLDEGKINQNTIAAAYRKTTSSCQMWAQVMGKRDELAAQAIYFEDDLRREETNPNASAMRRASSSPLPSQKETQIRTRPTRKFTDHCQNCLHGARAA